MTQPAPQRTYASERVTLSRILLVIGAVLFVLASITTGGVNIGDITAWTWGFGAFAAWCLAGAV